MRKNSAAGYTVITKGVAENLAVALAYWLISHLNWLIFKNVGVLPMPIWPAAALAVVVAFYRGWQIAPGIAIGTILANYYSLGAPWGYAVCIAIMNTAGPIIGAGMMRWRVSAKINIRSFGDVMFCFLAIIILVPVLTATGGIGFKWLLGLIPANEVVSAWLKWAVAHSLGTLVFGVPVFAFLKEEI
ncbi:MAG TPA: MASE1 domain-containing protein [Candidatus Omnitrophota bacterium]|nr:MASE1 domain-containing protein [Candidatus Omnitrophota bacterium]HPS20965.1 MASE1 domain-containing protein [Candidatus Omnitrophota bacterium]